MQMDWKKLLSIKRLGRVTSVSDAAIDPRTEFTRDYDRIIFSSAFRRLQDKTQVFPLAKSDYVRTRLTHSLEVASVGRSLGMLAADTIIKNEPGLKACIIPQDVGTIVATACLAHDIGNPPFGHAGESAIQEWFEARGASIYGGMCETQREDLLKFEGNAQGFRTLCTLQNLNQRGGLQLTSAVLGTFTKYPRASQVEEKQSGTGISGKKFGFMSSEAELFSELAVELGLIKKTGIPLAWNRHPLAFLVEAADDICYHIMDVEDGFKAGVIKEEELLELYTPWMDEKAKAKLNSLGEPQRQAEYLRATTIHRMIYEAHDVFENNYAGLMSGTFDAELTTNMQSAKQFAAFEELTRCKVYKARPVLEIEACGFEVIGGLLSAFIDAIETKAAKSPIGKVRSRTILGLLPNGGSIDGLTPYQRALVATDFVSGMTDSYAVELYQRIRGIALP